MTTAEEQRARLLAGVHNQRALEKIAKYLHYNESIHLHDLTDELAKTCNYCWLRAGKAIHALRVAGLPIVLGPDPVQADEPVEVEADVLHALEAAASAGDRAEVQGWTAMHITNPGADHARRALVIRSQDHRHYAVAFPAFMHADPATQVPCHPAVPRPVVLQQTRYELAEEVTP